MGGEGEEPRGGGEGGGPAWGAAGEGGAVAGTGGHLLSPVDKRSPARPPYTGSIAAISPLRDGDPVPGGGAGLAPEEAGPPPSCHLSPLRQFPTGGPGSPSAGGQPPLRPQELSVSSPGVLAAGALALLQLTASWRLVQMCVPDRRLRTEASWARFWPRAHTRVAGLIPQCGACRRQPANASLSQ